MYEKPLPAYGNGLNVGDWLYVDDHARALTVVATKGALGESCNIDGKVERTNIAVVKQICATLDEKIPRDNGVLYAELITMVSDSPGHDRRYAIDATKIKRDLGWEPSETFESGLKKTVEWYMDNKWWWEPIRQVQPGDRLGALASKDPNA